MSHAYIKHCIIILFFLFINTQPCTALILNEVYPASAENQYEWVELYNDTSENIDLSHYTIQDATGKLLQLNNMLLLPQSYTIATSSNILNNSGDTVKLIYNNTVINSVSYSQTFTFEYSFARCPNSTGEFIKIKNPTQNKDNSESCNLLINLTPTIVPSNKQDLALINNIFISEVYPYPDNENEWIELYNHNNFTVTLNSWYLDDEINLGSSPYVFTSTICEYCYQTIEIPVSMFNNAGDTVTLLNSQQQIQDTIQFAQATKGKSYGKTNPIEDFVCLLNPSKNTKNNSCLITKPNTQDNTDNQGILTQTNPTLILPSSIINTTFISTKSATAGPNITIYFPQNEKVLSAYTKKNVEIKKSNSPLYFSISALLVSFSNMVYIVYKVIKQTFFYA